ncbi:autotransporter family protein [Achromobacter aloeverae]|uniref:Autotransporter domain-containing protein n=1 Tax=Achromobacter aloeverae TaxID=1750518 RepID=A0A4Q1HN22_9BURK|nr:autotransporter outer membrane beta-barrel domain-containing protein [Achromobacter aloeverae]RXN92394.1 hypothetical protein C7R54_01150 [Achromobacter aloeverae]
MAMGKVQGRATARAVQAAFCGIALVGAQAKAADYVFGPGPVYQPIRVQGAGNTVTVEGNTTIQPQEPYPTNYSGTGLQLLSGATAVLKADDGPIVINVHGHAADGLFVGNNSTMTVNPGGTTISVLTDPTDNDHNSRGIYTVGDTGPSVFKGSDIYITVDGSNSDALRSYGQYATVDLNDSTLTTTGSTSRGVTSWGGATITLNNTAISTQGTQAYGVWMTSGVAGQDTHVTMNGGSILTTGGSAYGVLVYPGTDFTGNGTSVRTTGNSYAVYVYGGKVDGTGMSILAEDTRALVVSQPTSVVDLTDATIRTTKDSTQTVWVSAGSATLTNARITADGSNSIPVWTTGGQTTLNGGTVTTSAASSRAILVQGGGLALGLDGNGAGTFVRTTGANADAVSVLNGTTFSADGATLSAEGANSLALRFYGGDATTPNTANLKDTTIRSAQLDGLYFYGGQGVVNMDGGSVTGGRRAVWVAPVGGVAASGTLNASNGAVITGIVGATAGSSIALNLASDSRWNVTADSTVNSLSNSHGTVDLQAAADVASRPMDASAYRVLQVSGNYSGDQGVVAVNTYLNKGGALSNQYTDRMLIAGNASGTSLVQVKEVSGSPGGLTAGGGVPLNDEGISLVQVAGTSSVSAFALSGDYVTVGNSPHAYRLFAYGPGSALGSADPAQSLVGGTGSHWDYRLQSAFVTPDGPTPDPEGGESGGGESGGGESGGGESGGGLPDPDEVRYEVAPQVASYLIAPIALQYATYADLDSLHRRLGEIRDDRALGNNLGKGEAFVRAYGGDFSYATNRKFKDFGYDASGNYAAVQFGGNLYKQATDNGIWRFGLAGTFGHLNYDPHAVDGPSKTKTDTYRVSGYATYQADKGWYVDGILSFGWFDGNVDTDARGKAMDLRGTSVAGSVEAGYPIDIGHGINLEPQAQVNVQRLSFNRKTDADGLDVDIASQTQVLGRLGARVTRPIDVSGGRITPYAGVHVLHAFNGGSNVTVGDETFRTGKYGDAMRYSAGVTGTVNRKWSLYGEVARIEAMGSGVDAWLFNAGARYRF